MAELFRRLAAREAAAFGQIAAHLWDGLRATARRRLKQEPKLAGVYDEDDALQSGLCAMGPGKGDTPGKAPGKGDIHP
jgi:hypothetical protein